MSRSSRTLLALSARRLVLLLLYLCSGNLFADSDPRIAVSAYPSRQRIQTNVAPQSALSAIVRVSANEQGSVSQGSGTLVGARGDYGLVVTNWHVIRDARGKIVVTFPDGSRSAATVAKVDEVWDLAALLIWRGDARPIPISQQIPDRGDLLTIAGYGSGNFRAATGRCTQYVAPDANMPFEMVEVSVEARQGDSGGPILNERGELAGVLFGADGSTVGTYCGRVRLFLESVWPDIDYVDDPKGSASHAPTLVAVHNPGREASWPVEAQQQQMPLPSQSTPRVASGDQREASRIPVIAPSISQPNHTPTPFDWQGLFGSTPLDQAKSILAGIGILAVLLQFAGLFKGRRNGSS